MTIDREVVHDTPTVDVPPLSIPEAITPPSGRPTTGLDGRRIWWTVAGVTVLLWGLQLFGYVDLYPVLSAAVVVLVLWGLGTIVAVWQPRQAPPWVHRLLAGITVALSVGAFLVWSFLQILARPAYGTDEVAFDQYAAQLLRHGMNPYTHSMAPAFALFHVSPDGYTFLLNGHTVTALSYPALSFLLYVPFLAAGWSTELAVAVNVLAWAAGIVLTYFVLPRPIRPLAIVVGSFSVYIGYAVGGVTDALFVPLLIGAVYRWDRFTWTRGPMAWLGPALLGLAMAVKQTPWLLLPFLVAGVALEARRLGAPRAGLLVAGRYLAIALAAFAVPNLPFLVADPHAWLSGVLTPIASHTIPAGQGLVGLSLFLGLGGGSLASYTIALVVVAAALWVIFVVTYPTLRAWAVIAPALVLFFSARSFGSYLVTLLPVALVAAATLGIDAPEPAVDSVRLVSRRTLRVTVAGAILLSAVAVGAIFTQSAPLAVRVTSVRTTGQLATVVQVGVEVTNTSGRTDQPSFTVESGGQITAFWLSSGGPSSLAPGQQAHYTLYAPNFFAQPPITGGFQVVAFGSSPASVSRSSSYLPTTLHLGIDPAGVSGVIPLDQPVVLRVALLDHLDRPVNEAGVPVYLGQVIYGQQGLVFGQAIINQGQVGQTPVVAYTDADGVATFTVRGTQRSVDPVYFEANLVDGRQYYPYGYSDIVPIRFGAP
ncbi:MAG TPA: hypothetical protein VIH95_05535 [Acidimicrobiales bacterium]